MADPTETPNQRQARLRRERRQAKIAAEGSDRLSRIAGGRPMPADEVSGLAQPHSSQPAASPQTFSNTRSPYASNVTNDEEYDDPDEMDVTKHITYPQRMPTQPQQQMPTDDPMMKMLQSLMNGQAPDPSSFDQAGLPPGLAEMFAAGAGGPTGGPQAQLPPTVSSATWRIVHALTSLILAVYVTLSSPLSFTGSKEDREFSSITSSGADFGARLFFWFATVEVVLQSSRFFLERGQLGGSGWLGTLTKILPEPYAGYLRVVGRYGVIFSTVVSDALVVVFALGVVAWWNGTTSKAVSSS